MSKGFVLFDGKLCLTRGAHHAYAAREMDEITLLRYNTHRTSCQPCTQKSLEAVAAQKAYEVRRDGVTLYVSGHLTDDAIEAYLDNNLHERLRMSLEGHAKTCDRCSEKLTEIAARSGVLLKNS